MLILAFVACLGLGAGLAAPDAPPFGILVVDSATGRGVPLVELRTVNGIQLVTDSSGLAAFDEPGLMGRDVYFHVSSHGYEHAADGFGYRGRRLRAEPGGHARVEVRRINVAERLYRTTGGGIYRDSLLLGRPAPIRQPLLNGRVLGCDSVQTAVFGGKMLWIWGDTNRPEYPLGLFEMSGATSDPPGLGGLDPDRGIDLDVFTGPDGFARAMARVPGPGPTWLDGLMVVRDAEGHERLFAAYMKIRPPLDAYERGLVEFDPWHGRFARESSFPLDTPAPPRGHPFRHRGGDSFDRFYFSDAYALTRVAAAYPALADPANYEALTYLKPGGVGGSDEVERDGRGRPVLAWRRGAAPPTPELEARLVRLGKLAPEHALFQLRDVETGKRVVPHKGSIAWNPHRHRWLMIVAESGGTSFLGETWAAEAASPTGPWIYARKVVTHERYSFYNPKQHPELAGLGGRLVYFEGTYTTTFSGNDVPTPRYDYNQVMYRLDLDDPRMNLPAAIDRLEDGRLTTLRSGQGAATLEPAAFYALERPGPGTRPVDLPGGETLHILAPDAKTTATRPLVRYRRADGSTTLGLDGENPGDGWERDGPPLGHAWPNPYKGTIPGD